MMWMNFPKKMTLHPDAEYGSQVKFMVASPAKAAQHENHHIIPRSVVKNTFPNYYSNGVESKFNQSDNLIELPRTPGAVPGTSLPSHRSSDNLYNHPTYNRYVQARVNALSSKSTNNVKSLITPLRAKITSMRSSQCLDDIS